VLTTPLKCLKSWYLQLISTTFKFEVFGDSHEELRSKAEALIANFLRNEDEPDFEPEEYLVSHSVNYEMVVSENQDMLSDSNYTAEVIARMKHGRD
jgi:hypothetical protein